MKGRFGIAAVSIAALMLAACGRDDGDGGGGGGGDGGVKTDKGVTTAPCPGAKDQSKGCIYLGILSDLTEGPFRGLAVPVTDGQKAFWKRVNDAGGIGGKYEVDVTKYVKDNKYKPEVHAQVYNEIKDSILGIAQTLGSPTTAAIINDLKKEPIVSVPASWTSGWLFEDVILESGANYCVEAMNSVDYAVESFKPKTVMAVHYPGDYGDDAMVGAKLAAQANNLTFEDVPTTPGANNQAAAVSTIVSKKPDLVMLAVAPAETAVIVGQAAAAGFKGKFIGTSPTWNPALNQSPAAPALKALYLQSGPWPSWSAETAGHKAMRAALPGVTPNDGYVAGWVWSYPMKAALEQAVKDGDLTRKGLADAVKKLNSVDYEGMLPSGAGNYSGDANSMAFRQTLINKVDTAAPTGVSEAKAMFEGPTAKAHKFDKACYQSK